MSRLAKYDYWLDLLLLHHAEEDVVKYPHYGEGTPDDGQNRCQEVVPLATPLLDVHAHRAKVVAELRLRHLQHDKRERKQREGGGRQRQ